MRAGTYVESVRVTKDVTICGLGAVTVVPPGWEAAFVWGGYSVGRTRAGDEVLLPHADVDGDGDGTPRERY